MNKQTIFIGVLLVALVAGGYFFSRTSQNSSTQQDPATSNSNEQATQGSENLPDDSDEYTFVTQVSRAIRFQYPTLYALTEKEVGNAERTHYVITLVRATDTNNGDKGNTEGPRAITFDFYQNKEKLTPEQWVKQSSFSNFKLSPDGHLERGQFGDKPSVTYRWDGLYAGKSLVTTTSGDILMISVTYDGDADPRLADYEKILSSVEFVGIVR